MKLLLLDTSPSEKSRSRCGLDYAEQCLKNLQIDYKRFSSKGWHLVSEGGSTESQQQACSYARECDGYIVAGPVYDWGPAPQTLNALIHIISSDDPKFKPITFIAGSGGVRALLSYTSLVQTVITETDAVVVGSPVMLAGDACDRDIGFVSDDVKMRIQKQVEAIIKHATVYKS